MTRPSPVVTEAIRKRSSRSAHRRRQQHYRRLMIEPLEDRRMLSIALTTPGIAGIQDVVASGAGSSIGVDSTSAAVFGLDILTEPNEAPIPAPIDSYAIGEAEVDSTGVASQRKIAVTSDEHLHVVYYRQDAGGVTQVFHAESADGGRAWVNQQVTFGGVRKLYPALAVDSSDVLHLVYQDANHATYYMRKTETWQAAEWVASYATTPAIVVDSHDDIHVVYGVYIYDPGYWGGGNGVRYRVRTSAGWQPEESISSNKNWTRNPAIAIDGTNNVHVVWDQAPSGYYDTCYRVRTSSGWGTEVKVNAETDNNSGTAPSIAVDGENHVHIVWHYLSSGNWSIKYRKHSGVLEPTVTIVGPTPYYQVHPIVSVDDAGRIHVFWNGQHSNSPTAHQLQHRQFDTAWEPVEDLTVSATGDQFGVSALFANHPRIAGRKTNVVGDGYSLIWMDDTTIRFGAARSRPTDASEILARGVAYADTWLVGDSLWFDGQDLGYVVDKVFEHYLGFYGLGLSSALHGPALVLRGTDQWRDWASNLHPGGVGWPQFDATWEMVYSEWLEKQTEAVDMIGHSLGGALAQWFAAAFTSIGGQVDQLVTFNSPGIPAAQAQKFVPSDTTSVTHYIVNGDVVSIFGQTFVEGTVQMGSFWDLNLLNKHVLPLLEARIWNPDKGQYRERPDDLTWETISTDELNSPSFSFTDLDYRLWLLGMQVGLHAINAPALAIVPHLLKTRGTADASRTLIGTGLQRLLDVPYWSENPDGSFALTLSDQVRRPYRFLAITVAPEFNLTSNGNTLEFGGGLSIAWQNPIHIELPSWLGGPIGGEHLIELAGMDINGIIDEDKLEVNGRFEWLGSLIDIDGRARLDWQQNALLVSGDIDILGGFLTTEASTSIAASGDFALRGGADIRFPDRDSLPWGLRWLGGKHIIGGDFLLNYTNDQDSSNDFVAVWWNIADGARLGLRVWSNGWPEVIGAKRIEAMEAQSGGAGGLAGFAPLASGAFQLQAEPYAQWYPIPENRDWAWFFIEWENPSPDVAFHLRTPSGQVLGEAEIEADPSMRVVAELSNEYGKVVLVQQPEPGAWQVMVDDTTGLGVLEMAAMVSEPAPAVCIVGMSSGLLREPVELEVAVSGSESQVRVALFYDTDAEGLDGVMIVDGLVPDNEGRVRYRWDTAGVAAGEYYVYARAMDEVNVPVAAYADAPVEISDPVPEVTTLAADLGPVIRSAALTLTAEVAFEPIDDILQVEFYRGDDLLGADAYGNDGWTWTADTADWPLGEQPVTARAQTIGGVWSDWDSATVTLIENPAQIHMTIAAEPSATGDGGQVASLPNSVDWVHKWQTFWAEIWVGAPDIPTLAVADATVDLRYNADYLTALEIEYGSAFPLDRTGTIGDGSGLIGGIGGATESTGVGGNGYLLLARVRFASTGDDQLPVDEVGRNIGPYDMQIELTEAQTKWVDAGTVVPQLGDTPGTELWAVMYDIEQNNRIDFGDLSYFAAAFGRTVGPPESQPPFVWWADFDKSGSVDFGDLSFFAPNFAKRRDLVQSGAQTLIFPPNFPDAWRPVAGGGGEGEAMGGNLVLEPSSVGRRGLAGSNGPQQGAGPLAAGTSGVDRAHAVLLQNLAPLVPIIRGPGTTDATFAQLGRADGPRISPWQPQPADVPWVAPAGRRSALAEAAEHAYGRTSSWEPLEDVLALLAGRTSNRLLEEILEPHEVPLSQADR